jgi:hypothetical protein
MSAHRGLLAFALLIVTGVAALLVAGSADKPARAFTLEVPNVGSVGSIGPGQQACEAPVQAPAAFGAVAGWGLAGPAATTLALTVRDAAGGQLLAHGTAPLARSDPQFETRLSTPVPAGRRLRVCIRNSAGPPVVLLGSAPSTPGLKLSLAGRPSSLAFSLVMLRPHPRSLLTGLPQVFDRAALFRPAGVGPWTFWLLLGGALVAIVLAGVAVATASDPGQGEDAEQRRDVAAR